MRADNAGVLMAELIIGTVALVGLLVLGGSCPGARAEPGPSAAELSGTLNRLELAADAGPVEGCAPVLRQLLGVQRVALVADARAAAAERTLERERREAAAALERSAAALRALAAEAEAQPAPPSRLVWLSAGVAVGAALALLGSNMQ